MAPPMLFDDFAKTSAHLHETDEASENDLRYDSREPNFRIFSDETVIPDDSFGPDEERIFIDDDPYDLDAAFFAIHKENAPIMNDDKKLNNFGSSSKNIENKVAQSTDKNLDYIEESLIKTKLQDRRIIDNYLRNQRGTGRSDYEDEKMLHERIQLDEKKEHTTIRNSGYENQSDRESNENDAKKESRGKSIDQKSTDSGSFSVSRNIEQSTTGQTIEANLERTHERQYHDDAKTFTIEASKNLVDSSTTIFPNEVVKREGFYGSGLSLESNEGDESYDGELSKEIKITSGEKNQTAGESGHFMKNRHDYGTETIGNETTKDDSSAGGEITKEDDVVESEEKILHPHDNGKFSFREKTSDESSSSAASFGFENKESSNETTIGGSMNIYSQG